MRKTVPQVTTKLELSITLVKHALAEPITLYGIGTIACRGQIAPAASTSLRTAQAPPTVYARLAVLGHILRVPTKIHVHRGQIAPPDSTSLQTERVPRIVFAAVVRLENILRMLTKVHAPLGQLA